MKTTKDQRILMAMSHERARLQPDHSTLVVIGAVLALALLSGCASAPAGGSSELYEYNKITGYPAVGNDIP